MNFSAKNEKLQQNSKSNTKRHHFESTEAVVFYFFFILAYLHDLRNGTNIELVKIQIT